MGDVEVENIKNVKDMDVEFENIGNANVRDEMFEVLMKWKQNIVLEYSFENIMDYESSDEEMLSDEWMC